MSQRAEPGVEYQLGVHDIDMSGSIADDDDVIEFDYEAAAVFKRLADDIYESAEAGVREPLTNAITTVRKANRAFDVSDGVITITVQDGEQVMMRMRDTGEGITKSLLNTVMTVIGRSTARDDGELSGQYGMGFLASYKLVGLNGGFLMCTNPRGSEEGPYSGLFKPGAFEPDNNNSLPQLLDDDEHGTVFEYYVKDDITIKDIREWVNKHARWSPIPILYRELDEDGNEQYNEDFHSPTLPDQYGDSPTLHVDTPYYEASTSPDAENDIILITSPVRMSGTRKLRKSIPWNVDLRLKYENGIVVSGPHEGKVPVTSEQYNSMDEGRREKHVSKDQLTEEDLTLPEPTGTRERLRKDYNFLKHVNNQLRSKYLDVVEDTLDDFNPSVESMQDLDEMEYHVMMRIFSDFDDEDKDYTPGDVKAKLSSSYEYDNASEDLSEFILAMTQNVRVVSKNKGHDNKYPRHPVYELVEDDERVFMCVSTNSWKAGAVEKADEPTHIVQLKRSSEYTLFEKHLGWTKLKEVKKSNATEVLELCEEELEDITVANSRGSKADNIEDYKLTVHHASGGRNTLKRTANWLVEEYSGDGLGKGSHRFNDVLLLFPRLSEYNVSDYYDLADHGCTVASCSRKLADYLTENAERILLYKDYEEWVTSHSRLTSHGTRSVGDLLDMNRPVLVHPKQYKNYILHDKTIMSAISRRLQDTEGFELMPVYTHIEPNLWRHIMNLENVDTSHVTVLIGRKRVTRRPSSLYIDEVKLYTRTRLPEEFHDVDEVQTIESNFNTVTPAVVSVVETIIEAAEQNDGELASMQEETQEKLNLPTLQTEYGELSLEEAYDAVNRPCDLILHPLTSERIGHFDSDAFLKRGAHALNSLDTDYDTPTFENDALYVPLLETEFERLKEHIHSETTVLRYMSFKENAFAIEDRDLYAALSLPNWDMENDVTQLIQSASFDVAKDIVDSVVPLHDAGKSPKDVKDRESAVSVTQDAVLN